MSSVLEHTNLRHENNASLAGKQHQLDRGQVFRFGILCNGRTLEEWQSDCVRHLLREGGAELGLLVIDENAGVATRALRHVPFRRWLYTWYRRTWFSKSPRRPVDMRAYFSGIAEVRPSVTYKGRFSQHFDDESLDKIRSFDLDFLLRFGFNILRGEVLSVARYGVWSFHHGDEEKYRGSPAGFWEIYLGDPVCGAILQRLTDRLDGGIVLRRGYLKTVDHSYTGNIDSLYRESATWPALACKDMRNGSTTALAGTPSRTKAPVYYPPGNLQMFRFGGKIIRNSIRRKLADNSDRRWRTIGIVDGAINMFLDPQFKPPLQFVDTLADTARSYLFSPAVSQDGRIIFAGQEETKGALCTILGSLAFEEGSCRLSGIQKIRHDDVSFFPGFAFNYAGDFYSVSISSGSDGIGLYRLDLDQQQWVKVSAIADNVRAASPAIFKHEDRWWLFCIQRARNENCRLIIYFADDLFSEWQVHPGNPVKIDIRSSQPAGTPFIHEGGLYRPASNHAAPDGPQLVINRVLELSDTRFTEEVVRIVSPADGCSHRLLELTSWGDKTVVMADQ